MPLITLDFDAIVYPVASGDFAFRNGNIFEDGFTVDNLNANGAQDFGTLRSSSGYFRHDLNDNIPYVTFTDPATGRSSIRLTKDDGESWDLVTFQIDSLAPINFGSGFSTINITGLKADGVTSVQATLTIDDSMSLQTLFIDFNQLASFRDLIRLDIEGPANFQFNDIVLRDYALGTANADVMIAPGAGDDFLRGGGGGDTFVFGSSFTNTDFVDGGAGDDVLELRGNYTLAQNVSLFTIRTNIDNVETIRFVSGSDISKTGGNPNDRFNYSMTFVDSQVGAGQTLTLDAAGLLSNETLTVVATAETNGRYVINGGAGADSLSTGAGNDILNGGLGNDILDGGTGTNELRGGAGDDSYVYKGGGDQIFELAGEGGADRVWAYASFTLSAGAEVEILATYNAAVSTPNPINLTGNALSQTIYGNNGFNILDGGGGGDAMVGFNGDDWYYVRNAADTIDEVASGGNDQVFAAVSWVMNAAARVETLATIDALATTAIDLTGNGWRQSIRGNAGDNILDGKDSRDDIQGGAGADTFKFTAALGVDNVVTILDFVSGTDKLAFGGISPAQLQAGGFRLGTGAQDADDRIIYDQATGNLYYDGDGNGAGAQILFAILNGAPVLTAGDFVTI